MAVRLPIALTRAPIRSSPLKVILTPLPIIAIACLLILSSDNFLEVPLLYSRCHAHSLHPSLSRSVPFFGPLSCFAVSFFEYAVASTRGLAVMATIWAFTAALLTVTYLESARLVAGPAGDYLRRLGLLWILVHIGGGPYVFIFIAAGWIVTTAREVRRINLGEAPADTVDADDDAASGRRSATEEEAVDADVRSKKRQALRRRRLRTAADALAVSDAVIIGFALPAALVLVWRSTAPITVWLFFPVWVILLRYLLLLVVKRLDARWQGTQVETTPRRRGTKSLDLESNRPALALVYAVPVLLSLAAHVALIWSLTRRDDSKSVTRAVLGYEAVNWGAIFVITVYSLFVEAGWLALLGAIGATVLLGPGAGVCIGWILRERVIRRHNDEDIDASTNQEAHVETEAGEGVGEQTPLLRS
ncbi:hypothetical protein B0T11DRAFT_277412 [Plectosphaerella cucumerina]|jgi:hypothetical protein|uniref:Uncharacterized protein n=1 Tax=Plectosphaerella cucumerina TaxID=40658 RepID=A0A8K0TN43_9PEZI|nr:hypothetical protein B0T11DRAFT_277412 [Plectosphaerella cucumerina]